MNLGTVDWRLGLEVAGLRMAFAAVKAGAGWGVVDLYLAWEGLLGFSGEMKETGWAVQG